MWSLFEFAVSVFVILSDLVSADSIHCVYYYYKVSAAYFVFHTSHSFNLHHNSLGQLLLDSPKLAQSFVTYRI